MNGSQNQNNVGEQIKDALADALQSGDFKNLNNLVSQTVAETLNEVGKQISESAAAQQDIPIWQQRAEQRERQKQEKIQRDWQEQLRRRQEELRKQEQFRRQEAQRKSQEHLRRQEQMRQEAQLKRQEHLRRQEQIRQQAQLQRQEQLRQQSSAYQGQPRPINTSLVKRKNVGSVSSILYRVFGGIGLGIAGWMAFVRLLFSLSEGTASVTGWIVNLVFLAGFFGMIQLGRKQSKRLKRADRYVSLCDYRMYGDIEKLAMATGKSRSYVQKDIQKMLHLGMFPEGHLDEQKTCFMLNDVVYRQYLALEENRKNLEAESKQKSGAGEASSEQVRKAGQADESNSAKSNSMESDAAESGLVELNAMVSEGMECICKLRNLNDEIEGEVISGKLFQLENLLKEIFDSVREHPEQMHRMHKLMDYYLPTTLKLVEAYKEFDEISVPGREVLEAKAEIEKTLDIINQAFKELLNNLFQDAVFDATTDAQVLKTMLAREGLTKEMEPEPVPLGRK